LPFVKLHAKYHLPFILHNYIFTSCGVAVPNEAPIPSVVSMKKHVKQLNSIQEQFTGTRLFQEHCFKSVIMESSYNFREYSFVSSVVARLNLMKTFFMKTENKALLSY